jgi:hypothetical protein
MKFQITSTDYAYDDIKVCPQAIIEESEFGNIQTVELNSLEQLLDFAKTINHDLILIKNHCSKYPFKIEIYNNYRE